MGDRYVLNLQCAYCGKLNKDVYYAPDSDIRVFKCEKCNELNTIMLKFYAKKAKETDAE